MINQTQPVCTPDRTEPPLLSLSYVFLSTLVALMLGGPVNPAAADEPNIVVILADDLGYGDVSAYNPQAGVETPNIDRIASEGMRFTDGHSSAAVCTPTRYSLVTGRYSWRTRLKGGVLGGYSQPLISPDRETIGSVLQEQGYHTGAVGKWHLGLGWQTEEGVDQPKDWSRINADKVKWNEQLKAGAHTVGFDYSYLFPASLDMAPYVYIRNGKVTNVPTKKLKKRSFPRFVRNGPKSPGFDPGNTLDRLTDRATGYMKRRAEEDRPFFLYFPLTAPHKPAWPAERFQGRSGIGPHGDFILQVDWTVGQIDRALKDNGLAEDTLIVVTSDNGSYMREVSAGKEGHMTNKNVQGYRVTTHRANGHLHGRKGDIYEGGHRVPFIVRWPGEVKAGSVNDQPVTQVDLLATFADITGAEIPEGAAGDSFSMLPALHGETVNRPPFVHRSQGSMRAIRDGRWKLIFGNGSGGRIKPRGGAGNKPFQLYDMNNDPRETTNLIDERPEVVKRLKQAMERIRESGRTPK